jgi:ribonuclease P protein component
MLPIKNRLTKKKDFQKVYQKGTFFSLGNLNLRITKNEQGETRVGFLVGKRVAKKAVERNTIKRKIRNAVRLNLSNIKLGWDVVIYCRQPKDEKKFKCEQEEIKKLLIKSKLIKN